METINSMCLAGFNRHGDLPVLERWLSIDARTRAIIEAGGWVARFDVEIHALVASPKMTRSTFGDSMMECAARLGEAAVALQRSAGFAVTQHGALKGSDTTPLRFFAEYDLEEGGAAAIDLAIDLLAAALQDLPVASAVAADFQSRYQGLCDLARRRATPAHTRALIDAARRRDIARFRMDREPYLPVQGAFRLRPDGLLRLGQARHQRTVDGSFCIERSQALQRCARDRAAMFDQLRRMDCRLPMAVGAELRACDSPVRASRLASRMGFPVVLKTVQRRSMRPTIGLEDRQAVSEAASRLLAGGPVFVEPYLPGRVLELVYVGQRRLAILQRDGEGGTGIASDEDLPEGLLETIDALAIDLELLSLSVAIILDDSDANRKARVIDVDPAPPLDRLLRREPALLEAASDRMITWLFPACCQHRIPIAAVTGTNGKTTTCCLLESIMRQTGMQVGMACSTGSYLDGEELGQHEDAYLPGHLTIIDNPNVAVGILETTRGAAMSTGVGFDRCEVSACLNVSNDHLDDELEIRTVEELARIKQWIVERGDRPVLNADDPHCLAMARELKHRQPVLVSNHKQAAELVSAPNDIACVIERIDERDWIVLHAGSSRRPVVAVDEVPVTFGGRAEHNTSNALHAVAMAQLLGADISSMATGLRLVRPDADQLPGRLNLYRSGEIQVIVDYAHNPEGLAQLTSFCQRLDVSGRRIIAVTLPANRGDNFVIDGVAAIAGLFDHYVCKNYRIRYGRQPHEVPQLLRTGLEREGVARDRITLIEDEEEAITHTLEMAQDGDLVVLMVGKSFRELGRTVQTFLDQRGTDLCSRRSGDGNKPGQLP